MSMMKAIFIVSFLSVAFTMDLKGDVDFDREKDYTGLPNEFQTLTGLGIIKDDTFKREIIYKLKNVIGALPFPEQIAFINALNSKPEDSEKTDNTFNSHIYTEEVENKKLYQKELQSIIDYLEDYEKQMSYGMGCLQYTANKYVYDNEFNQEMHSLVYEKIDNLIEAQAKGI
ncbi:MAG: hypothetical protein MJ252_31085, partial [archaeon]|nr:hypothetical protein [archaeon]